MGPVVAARRRGGLEVQAEAQTARAVLRAVQEVVDFFQVAGTALELVLDHAPPPRVGARVAHRAGNAFPPGEFVDKVSKRKLEGIERDRVPALEVAVAVAETADEGSVAQFLDPQQRRRHGSQRAGQLDVDVGLALRSHIHPSDAGGPTRGLQRFAVKIGIRVRDGVQGLVQTEGPQNGDVGPERDTGLAELQSVERVAIDPGLGRDFRDGHPAAGPGQTYPAAKLLGTLHGLSREDLSCAHNFRR